MKITKLVASIAVVAANAAFGNVTNIDISADAEFALPDNITKLTKTGSGKATFTTATLPEGGAEWSVSQNYVIPYDFNMNGHTLTITGTLSNPYNNTTGVKITGNTTFSNPGDIIIGNLGSLFLGSTSTYPADFGTHEVKMPSTTSHLGFYCVGKPFPYNLRVNSSYSTLAVWEGDGWAANKYGGTVNLDGASSMLRLWARSFHDITFMNSIYGAGKFYKTGQGRVIVTGNTESVIGCLYIDRGGFIVSDGAKLFVTNNTATVGYPASDINTDGPAFLSIGTNSTFYVSPKVGGGANPLHIAYGSSATHGYMNILNGAIVSNDLYVANDSQKAIGAVRQLGGELRTIKDGIRMANNVNSYGCYFMTGGEMYTAKNQAVHTGMGYGLYMVKGGYFKPDHSCYIGNYGGHGEMYVKNAEIFNQYSMYIGDNAPVSGYEDRMSVFTADAGGTLRAYSCRHDAVNEYTTSFNMRNGGVMKIAVITKTKNAGNKSHCYINANNGTLYTEGNTYWTTISANDANYIPPDRLTVYEGGITFNVNMAANSMKYWRTPIVKPTGKGVKSIKLPDEMTKTTIKCGYFGPAKVLITGAGCGATAVCDYDVTQKAITTGTVSGTTKAGNPTEIIVTNPGWDYTDANSITCRVYCAKHYYTNWVAEVTLADNVQTGSVTKTGAGNMMICCTNNYGGATYVKGGTLTAECEKVFPTTTDIMVDSGTTVDLGGYDTPVNGVGGAGTIKNGGSLSVNKLYVKIADINANKPLLLSNCNLTFAANAEVIVTDYTAEMKDLRSLKAVSGGTYAASSGTLWDIPVKDAEGNTIDGWVLRGDGNVLRLGKVAGLMILVK